MTENRQQIKSGGPQRPPDSDHRATRKTVGTVADPTLQAGGPPPAGHQTTMACKKF